MALTQQTLPPAPAAAPQGQIDPAAQVPILLCACNALFSTELRDAGARRRCCAVSSCTRAPTWCPASAETSPPSRP
eukprot:2234242-Rhodomonas_salina.2